jgi:cytosine/adenosine deaminase-related metal-dependent hydrolase
LAPIGDPYDALVQLAQPSNIDTVVVDGRILRRAGQFTGLDFEAVAGEAAEAASALKARAA